MSPVKSNHHRTVGTKSRQLTKLFSICGVGSHRPNIEPGEVSRGKFLPSRVGECLVIPLIQCCQHVPKHQPLPVGLIMCKPLPHMLPWLISPNKSMDRKGSAGSTELQQQNTQRYCQRHTWILKAHFYLSHASLEHEFTKTHTHAHTYIHTHLTGWIIEVNVRTWQSDEK